MHGEKKPHYFLSDVLNIVKSRGENAFTATGLTGAVALGLSSEQAMVLGLKQKDFYKSMTANVDHEIWQDVYHAALKAGLVA